MYSAAVVKRLLLLSLLWGSEFLFVEIALRHAGAIEVTFARLVLGTMFLAVVAVATRQPFPKHARFYLHSAMAGLLCAAAPYFLMSLAQERIDSGITGVLVGTGPLMTAALAAALVPGERVDRWRVAGLATGLCGVVLVMSPWNASQGVDFGGAIAALGVALGFACGYVYNARYLVTYHAANAVIMTTQIAFGALWVFFALAAQSDFRLDLNPESTSALLVAGLINVGAAGFVFFDLLRRAGPVATSIVEYLMVVVAVVLGVLFLDETLTLGMIGGAALVIGGISLAERSHRVRSPVTD